MASQNRRRPDRPRAPSRPPALGPGYLIAEVTLASPFRGRIVCARPVCLWVHWDGRRDQWCYGPGDSCETCKAGVGAKWTSWILAVRDCSRGIKAVQVSRAAACHEVSGRWADSNADLFGLTIEVSRMKKGPQAALRCVLSAPPLRGAALPRRTDLEAWVRHLYGVDADANDQGGAEASAAPPM